MSPLSFISWQPLATCDSLEFRSAVAELIGVYTSFVYWIMNGKLNLI